MISHNFRCFLIFSAVFWCFPTVFWLFSDDVFRLLKFSSSWTKLSMMGPQLFSGWYQMILDVCQCSQLFFDVFSWVVTFMDNHPLCGHFSHDPILPFLAKQILVGHWLIFDINIRTLFMERNWDRWVLFSFRKTFNCSLTLCSFQPTLPGCRPGEEQFVKIS